MSIDVDAAPLRTLSGIFFDWAGTTVDFGSCAPARVFVEIFRRRGITITAAEARGPMGLAKHEHIAAIAALPSVAEQWRDAHGSDPSDADVRAMYQEFLPLQKEALASGSEVIPGVAEAVAECRGRGLAIGSSTGYTRELMEVVIPIAERGGYRPDAVLCSDEVAAGRPAPWMNFRLAESLGVYPTARVVVVDDTPVGIRAARNAGMWAIAVSMTGNMMGLTEAEVAGLPTEVLVARLDEIERAFLDAGAHFVVRSVRDVPALLGTIDGRAAARIEDPGP